VLDRSDLRPYQDHAVAWSKPRKNNAKWVGMGLGKTVIELTAFSDLQRDFEASHLLAIAPKRVARKVWSDEVKEWSHLNHLKVVPIVGTADECFEAMRTPADIHTIGRDRVQWLHAQFIQNGKQVVEWPWDYVAVDESQSFASQSSGRFKCLYDLRDKVKFKRMSNMSGTPIPNGYMGLWSQFKLLDNGKRLGGAGTDMRDRWFTPPVGMFAKWSLRPRAEKLIIERVQDIVLTLREEDYLDLPPVVDNFVRVQLSSAAMRTYKEFEREYIAEVAGQKLTAVNTGVLDGKLLQLANGACYHGNEKKWVLFHDAKIEALEETLEGIPGKALIAYSYKHDLARIERVLRDRQESSGETYSVLQSDKSFEDWAAGKFDRGVLHPASAGHGLNSVYKAGCQDIIHFGCMNNLEFYQQVNARIAGGHRRMGRNVTIHHIVADGTRDDDYVRLIKRKALTQDALMESTATKIAA
jgi:SNF2 family DNA or RNA helicase